MQRCRYAKALISGFAVALTVVALAPLSFAQDAGTAGGDLRGPSAVAQNTTATSDPGKVTPRKIKKSRRVASMMAKYEWLDKVAESNPQVLAAICERPGAARILAQHRHIDKLAKADHYLCRRLTRWKGATTELIHNPKAAEVINLDPEGIYFAIDRDPHVATVLASHVRFDEMVEFNPDLARVVDEHIH